MKKIFSSIIGSLILKLTLVISVLVVPLKSISQVPTFQDCLGAVPICIGTYSNGNIITGTGNILNEINPATSCLLTGERNDAWYIITTSTAGNLNFTIVPNNPLHNYDWAVYNLTSSVCSDIFSNPALEVACNYSNLPGNTGPNGQPGLQNTAVIPVSNGQTYLINVSGFSSIQQNGYTIDLTGSSAMITDNTSPSLSSITAMNCGASSMTASFSERILCSSVQLSDFTLTGPGGPYTITSVTGTACNQNSPYSRDFAISFSPALPSSGSYTLTLVSPVSDLCGNSTSIPQAFTFSIAPINISFQKVDVTCFGGNNGSATAVISGPPGNYTYQWSPMGGSGQSAQFLTAGTYTVTVTSALGCSATASVVINQALVGLTASAVTTPANGCASNGTASVTVSNGQLPYTYSWWPTGGNGSTANNLAAGSYMVTITDANQCVLNYFFNVPSANGPSVSINSFNGVSCFGGNDGTATVTVTGASGPFSYQWLPQGGNGATASNLVAGNYTVEVTVAPGCTLTATVAITQPPTPFTVTGNAANTSCGNNNGSIILNPSGGVAPYSYQWNPVISSTATAVNLAGGAYSVTITDANGCSTVKNYNIQSSTQPVLTLANHTNVQCNGLSNGSTGVTVNGGTSPLNILWSSGHTATLINNIPAGTYTVTVTDASGCSASITDVITEPALLTASILSVQDVLCYGAQTGMAVINTSGGSGNNTWIWSGNASATSSINNANAGVYTSTVTDQNGCSASVQVTINQPTSPLIVQETIIPTSCGNSDGSISLIVNGGTSPYSYNWSSGSTSSSLVALVAGIYTVTVSDNNGCSIVESFTVSSSNAPALTITNLSNVTCAGNNNGVVNINVSGGIAPYSWNWTGGVSITSSASNLQAGTYNVTVTDGGGCNAFVTVNITEPGALQIQNSQPANICIGQNAIVNSTVNGGVLPYSYLWSNGSITSQLNVSPVLTNSYILTVTDGNGCVTVSAPVIVTVNTPLNLTASYPDSVCKGSNAGIQLTASGGDNNYSYTWSNNMQGSFNNIPVLQNTSVTVVLSDGCATPNDTVILQIAAVNAPDVNFNIPAQSGCEPFSAQFSIPASVPPGYLYLWNFGDGFTSSIANTNHIYINSGTYNVSLLISYPSGGSCSTTINFPEPVIVYPVPEARFIYDPAVPTINHPEVYFTDKSTGAISWLWNFGDGPDESRDQNTRHTYKDTGTYVAQLYIESSDGCNDSTFQIINISDEFQIYIPNAFTPDQSGVNDYFKIYGVGFSSYEMSIFDRWGKLVHYAKNREDAWDGKDEAGNLLPQGIYIYKVTVTDKDGNIHNRFDHVTLIR